MPKFDVVIRNGTIVTEKEPLKADLGITGDKIVALAQHLEPKDTTRVIDAQDKFVLPGGIDVHVHLQLPAYGTVSTDDFENGTKAAARGGITTVIDFSTQERGSSLMESIEARRKEAEGKVCVDYSLHASITDWNPQTQAEIKEIVNYGIPSFKMFMIYKDRGIMAHDGMLFSALEETKKVGGTIMVHAENYDVIETLKTRYATELEKWGAYAHTLSRPYYTESEAVSRAIKWAEVTGGQLYIVHMSAGESADYVKMARTNGVRVFAETCPQYLLLNDEVFKGEYGHYYATCPQVKKETDNMRLWQAVKEGVIQILASDTCTFNTQQKDQWNGDFRQIPFGLPGVETLLPLLYTEGVGRHKISLNHLVSLISTNPAKLFGMYPQKGTLAVGSDADVIIFNPHRKITLHSHNLQTNCDWSPYEGWNLQGYPETTILRGQVIVENYQFVGQEGFGKFLHRKPHGSL
ncbi:MAG: dihydropyrimidinase [Promethearchaeota archaeon]